MSASGIMPLTPAGISTGKAAPAIFFFVAILRIAGSSTRNSVMPSHSSVVEKFLSASIISVIALIMHLSYITSR